jgi:uncharacterized protein (DUF58 family)
MDWKVYARTDKLMIRRQSADTDANVVFLLDASGDMQSTDSGKIDDWANSKFGRALTSIAGLAQMAAKRGDPIALWVAGGKDAPVGLDGYIPPSQNGLHPIFHRLASVNPSGQADLQVHLEQLAQHLPRKSIVILISDWMEDPEVWGPRLEALTALGHDVRCLQLYSEVEWSLSLPESIQVFSEEQRNPIPLDSQAMQSDWMDVVQEYQDSVQKWAGRSRAIWVRAALEQELLPSLIRLVRGRV